MPNKVPFPDMPPNKNPMVVNVGVEISMIGFVYGGSLKRNHPTIDPPYGRGQTIPTVGALGEAI
jgi:hypothetical protein